MARAKVHFAAMMSYTILKLDRSLEAVQRATPTKKSLLWQIHPAVAPVELVGQPLAATP